jgi:hypothetical protein
MLNAGAMPRTDFRYEEFEGMLGSYYLSLLPLKDSSVAEDNVVFKKTVAILDGFAERYGVQKPEQAVAAPRATEEEWGQPRVFDACFTIVDMLGSFWRDFGVVDEQLIDRQQYHELTIHIAKLFERKNILELKYEIIEGDEEIRGVKQWNKDYEFVPLSVVIPVASIRT